MLQTLRLIRSNLRKMLSGYEFWLGAGLTVVLFLASPLYTDYGARRDVSVFDAMRRLTADEMRANTQFCLHHVLQACVSGWVKMFLPMIAAFPFVSFSCAERAAGSARFSCVRMPKRSYEAGTFLSAMLCGGLMLLTALTVFACIAALRFPPLSDYGAPLREIYERPFAEMYPFYSAAGVPLLYALRGAEMFLYGMVSAVPACFLTCLIRNKYLVLSFPFFLKYMLLQFRFQLLAEAYADLSAVREKQVQLADMIDPDRVSRLLTERQGALPNVLFSAALLTAAFVTFSLVLRRRWDYGA